MADPAGVSPPHDALDDQAGDAETHYARGNAYWHARQLCDAVAAYQRALSLKPDFADAQYNLAIVLKNLGRMEQAAASYRAVIAITPRDAEAHFGLGSVLGPLGHLEEARACFEQALGIAPDHAQAHHFLGITLQNLGRLDDAMISYRQAIALRPDDAETHYVLGMALQISGRVDEAMPCYGRALQLYPDHAEANYNLGIALQNLGRLDEAIACHARTLRVNPGHAGARSQMLSLQAHVCDWDGLLSQAGLIPELGVSGDAASPFCILSLDDNPGRNRIRAERCAAKHHPPAFLAPLARPTVRPDRIRIGYFSADFHDHAVMHCIARLFELHDRNRFSVHLFSCGPDRDDEMRRRLVEAADAFHDVRALTDDAVAQVARSQRIDIAVDLMGYTAGTRLGIFARRFAPIQVSYLGYPGTLGTPFIDYIVADRIVVPDAQRQHVSERIVYLPDSYQVNDDRRPISDHVMTRAEQGLPEQGFVFCCFNNSYKISTEEFDIWMRLLDRVDGSVLWLFRANVWVAGNLRKQAEKRGIDPDRLIFAERMPLPEHLARHALADLFLDTFNYNGHATASNALWAGLPVLTRPGLGFPARVGASLLTAIGLPELITTTSADYERLALELATAPQRLAQLREKLATNRLTQPLFDSELFTRHIETAWQTAYDRYFEGKVPADMVIT